LIWSQDVFMASFCERILICLMMNPESIHYSFEIGTEGKQEDYIWPVAGEATVNDKVFIVCTDAGSLYGGETVSKLFCQFMAAKVLKFGEREMSRELIDKLIIEERDRLISYARAHSLDIDLATTFSMVILYDQKVLISWHGDSRIYQLRGGEIHFSTKDKSLVSESIRNTAIAYGIKTDSSPIYAETMWIEDVQDGDYFLLCSKGAGENVTDDDIKLLVSQNDKANIDLTGSFGRLASERTHANYSMYLVKINSGTQKRGISNGIANRKQSGGIVSPISILVVTAVALLIMFFYFRKARTSNPESNYKNQTTQPADALRDDSVPRAIVMSTPGSKPRDVLRDDTVPSAIVMSAPRKQIPKVTDTVKNIGEKPQTAPQKDNSVDIQSEEKPAHINKTPLSQKKPAGQLLIKFTTDESCKLKITNMDLGEVIDWDLSQNDNGTIFLKPGKYSIVATSVIDGSKTKTYDFDVKSGVAHTAQNLRIKF
jgi:serine/threonine protein phosphatase PrpC